jgi:hypothetical protein
MCRAGILGTLCLFFYWNMKIIKLKKTIHFMKKKVSCAPLPGAQYVRNRCYRHFSSKSWNGPAIQVQTLNGLMELNSFGCKWPDRENSRSVWGPLRHSNAWAWTEHPSCVKLIGVLQLGVSEWNPRLWHFWGHNLFSRKCQWATPLNVRLT